jgi:septum formation protein
MTESSDRPAAASAHAGGLVLASTSVYRRALLERLGIPFRCRTPNCDESAWKSLDCTHRELAENLAHAKAASLVFEDPEAAIIGCDQLVSFDGTVLGKPGTTEGAIAQLSALTGKTHELITAMAVIHGGSVFRHTDVSRLRLRPLSRDSIERYVRAEQPLDCAGSYKLESRGIVLFDRIESGDHTAITGLPLLALVSILAEIGFEIP